MLLPGIVRFLLCVVCLSHVASPAPAEPSFDLQKLDTHIDIKLVDASMADAVASIAKLADIRIAAPADPESGLSANLKDQPVRTVLDALARMSGLNWYIEGSIVVFRRPAESPAAETSEKPFENLSPEEGMTEMLRSLDPQQLFRLSRGFALPYAELTPPQQSIMQAMLTSQNIGVTSSGTLVRALPKPADTSVSFYVIPYLLIPKPGEKETISVRLDSMPYIFLRKAKVD